MQQESSVSGKTSHGICALYGGNKSYVDNEDHFDDPTCPHYLLSGRGKRYVREFLNEWYREKVNGEWVQLDTEEIVHVPCLNKENLIQKKSKVKEEELTGENSSFEMNT